MQELLYINKLFNLEKSTSKYDFWNNKEEKSDFFVLLTFIIIRYSYKSFYIFLDFKIFNYKNINW